MNVRALILWLSLIPLVAFVGYPLLALFSYAVGVDVPGAPFLEAVSNSSYMSVLVTTLALCTATGVLSVLVALPAALYIWTRPASSRVLLLSLLILPMFMSYIVKIYAMRQLLGLTGLINQALVFTGVLDVPTGVFLFNRGSILATFVVLFIPFATLPIYLSLERVPENLMPAARDLGASSFVAMRRILLPLALPGLIAGGLFAFVLALGDFVTPQMVGGPNGMTFGRLVFSQFGLAYNYNVGAALGAILLAVVVALVVIFSLLMRPLNSEVSN